MNRLLTKIYYFVYAIFLFDLIFVGGSNIDYEFTDAVHKIVHIITVAGMVGIGIFKILSMKRAYFAAFVAIAVILLIGFYFSGRDYQIINLLLIIPAIGIDFKKLAKVSLVVTIAAVVSVIFCYLCGLIDASIIGSRNSLGFIHPNTCAAFFIEIICLWGYLRYPKYNILDFAGMVAICQGVYMITGNRSAYVSLILMVIVLLLFKNSKLNRDKVNKMAKIASSFIIPVCLGFSIVSSVCYSDTAIFKSMDNILSGRISYAAQFMDKYDVNLMGQKIQIISTQDTEKLGMKAMPLDNAYINMILSDGVVVTALFLTAYFLLLKKKVEQGDIAAVAAIVIYLVYGLSETFMFRYGYNFTIIMLAEVFANDRMMRETKKIKYKLKSTNIL